ncbi:MAG: hypothetical protein NC394_10525 [Bacteroides sp.]|nr:hypothetical protein [Bacteroides sp.]
MENNNRRSAVSVKRLAYAPLVQDTKKAIVYGEVKDLEDILISAGYTPRMNTASQYAGGQEYDSYVAKAGGTLEIQVPALTSEDEAGFFGSRTDEATGVVASNKEDVVPNVMVMYSTETSEHMINLYKFPKVKFTNQGESTTTKTESGITYQSQTLSGNYANLIHNGDDMYSKKGVDPNTPEGKKFIDDWFASAAGGTSLGAASE